MCAIICANLKFFGMSVSSIVAVVATTLRILPIIRLVKIQQTRVFLPQKLVKFRIFVLELLQRLLVFRSFGR